MRLAIVAGTVVAPSLAWAHGVSGGDAAYLAGVHGVQFWPYLYLGAKHMVTGYDHLLFLLGVVFFLYRLKDVALYASLFSVGHSLTLLVGVLGGIRADAHLVDAIIGLSVVYKGLDNLGGFRVLFGVEPNPRVAVLLFGLAHGFGLATKLQDVDVSPDGLVGNMVAFNIGVEAGQLLALSVILLVMGWWRSRSSFSGGALLVNLALIAAGITLFQYQMVGYFTGTSP